MPLLDDYTKRWQLTEPEQIAETHTSTVYRVQRNGESVILKLLKDHAEEERRGVLALKHWDAHGAIVPLAYDDGAQLLEYAPGPDLVPYVKRGDDQQASEIISGVLNQIHSRPVDESLPLPTLRRWFRSLFQYVEVSTNAHLDLMQRGAKLAEKLLATPQNVTVLHGDIHHENVRHSSRGWLVIDPKGIIGERTYDCANTLCNIHYRSLDIILDQDRLMANARILADAIETDVQRVLAFTYAYTCLSASWSIADGEMEPTALDVARLISPLLDD